MENIIGRQSGVLTTLVIRPNLRPPEAINYFSEQAFGPLSSQFNQQSTSIVELQRYFQNFSIIHMVYDLTLYQPISKQ